MADKRLKEGTQLTAENGECIYILEDDARCDGNGILWKAPATKKWNGKEEKCFLKILLPDKSSHIDLIERESEFRFSYPFLEKVRGSRKCRNGINVVEAEYMEGETLERWYETDSSRVHRFLFNNKDLSYKELISRHRSFRDSDYIWEKLKVDLEEGVYDVQLSDTFLKDTFRHMYQILKGVDYYQTCETECFAHRDIKPENIFILNQSRRAVIFDFDLAHIRGFGTKYGRRGGPGGTPGYYDPFNVEYKGKTASLTEEEQKKWDIYSLGRTFFYMLFGVHYYTPEERENWDSLYDQDYGDPDVQKFIYGMDLSENRKSLVQKGQKLVSYLFERKASEREELQKLKALLEKMVCSKDKRYVSAKEILRDFTAFLTEYYGEGEDYYYITDIPWLLDVESDRRRNSFEKIIQYERVSKKGTKGWVPVLMPSGSMLEIDQYGVPVMILLCLKDRIEYVPLGKNVKEISAPDNYRIERSAEFEADIESDKKVRFRIRCMN